MRAEGGGGKEEKNLSVFLKKVGMKTKGCLKELTFLTF
jgi:hypothetical protein